ncbi:MAG: 2-isopropylmalate synthase [Thermosediminibacterales bacterium]|nr:2-isopropylmalate synthase [Thermosediminibacterales bacterium]MDK2835248.1 2-isopropylmalate synthase [Thermosediminibacterales bacterium]
MGRIYIFDTTLRDGEQSPGISLNLQEKLEIAKQLAALKVDVIEAGFPIASKGDFESVKQIAQKVKGPVIAGLARANYKDIDTVWEAVKFSEQPRIHTFIATSDIHMKYKLKMTKDQVLEAAYRAVKHAKKYTKNVEFSAEDAVRSDLEFLYRVFEEAIKAGAEVINIPDTVGYATPWEFGKLIKNIRENVPNIDKAVISVHCHNDLGLAVANTLAAIKNGAQQVECTINGLGERAGNAALEEIVMALATRKDFFEHETGIETRQIYRTSKLVSSLTGVNLPPNKAIVGANAFAHESGIHQHGVIEEKSTYEIMTPETIGLAESKLVMGKHSGRHAFREKLKELGYDLADEDINKAFIRFKELADKKKEVTDLDIEALISEQVIKTPEVYELEYLHITSGNKIVATATVKLKVGDEVIEEAACGDGPVDASYKAIDRAVKGQTKLVEYAIKAVTGGKDALGEVVVKIERNNKVYIGRGLSTDIIEASARAYLNAINKSFADTEINAEDVKTTAV